MQTVSHPVHRHGALALARLEQSKEPWAWPDGKLVPTNHEHTTRTSVLQRRAASSRQRILLTSLATRLVARSA